MWAYDTNTNIWTWMSGAYSASPVYPLFKVRGGRGQEEKERETGDGRGRKSKRSTVVD